MTVLPSAQPVFTPAYTACLTSLRKALRNYTPERYEKARNALFALVECDDLDVMPDGIDKLYAYVKISKDNQLGRLAAKLDRLHAETNAA